MSHQSDLIDTTEMYLRTVYELEEEGVVPLRARIAERLNQSGPTVSQTVARMERDGLLVVADDRHLELTDAGRHEAVGVMRKHRLAERLLADVIGLDWEDVHIEACRWEHVMSDKVERRILALLDKPLVCPHGNPIPGLDQLGLPFATAERTGPLLSLSCALDRRDLEQAPRGGVAGGNVAGNTAAGNTPVANTPAVTVATVPEGTASVIVAGTVADTVDAGYTVIVDGISEQIQPDADLMHELSAAGIRPGRAVQVRRVAAGIEVTAPGRPTTVLSAYVSDHLFVRAE